jgi:hypothetical protein
MTDREKRIQALRNLAELPKKNYKEVVNKLADFLFDNRLFYSLLKLQ